MAVTLHSYIVNLYRYVEKEVVCIVKIYFRASNIKLCLTINKSIETRSSRKRFCYQQILKSSKFSSNSI